MSTIPHLNIAASPAPISILNRSHDSISLADHAAMDLFCPSSEKKEAFVSKFLQLETRRYQHGKEEVILVRKKGEEPWQYLNKPGLDSKDLSYFRGRLFVDVIQGAISVQRMIQFFGIAVTAPKTAGLSLAAVPAVALEGAVAAGSADVLLQFGAVCRGYQRDIDWNYVSEKTLEGLICAGAFGVGAGLTRAFFRTALGAALENRVKQSVLLARDSFQPLIERYRAHHTSSPLDLGKLREIIPALRSALRDFSEQLHALRDEFSSLLSDRFGGPLPALATSGAGRYSSAGAAATYGGRFPMNSRDATRAFADNNNFLTQADEERSGGGAPLEKPRSSPPRPIDDTKARELANFFGVSVELITEKARKYPVFSRQEILRIKERARFVSRLLDGGLPGVLQNPNCLASSPLSAATNAIYAKLKGSPLSPNLLGTSPKEFAARVDRMAAAPLDRSVAGRYASLVKELEDTFAGRWETLQKAITPNESELRTFYEDLFIFIEQAHKVDFDSYSRVLQRSLNINSSIWNRLEAALSRRQKILQELQEQSPTLIKKRILATARALGLTVEEYIEGAAAHPQLLSSTQAETIAGNIKLLAREVRCTPAMYFKAAAAQPEVYAFTINPKKAAASLYMIRRIVPSATDDALLKKVSLLKISYTQLARHQLTRELLGVSPDLTTLTKDPLKMVEQAILKLPTTVQSRTREILHDALGQLPEKVPLKEIDHLQIARDLMQRARTLGISAHDAWPFHLYRFCFEIFERSATATVAFNLMRGNPPLSPFHVMENYALAMFRQQPISVRRLSVPLEDLTGQPERIALRAFQRVMRELSQLTGQAPEKVRPQILAIVGRYALRHRARIAAGDFSEVVNDSISLRSELTRLCSPASMR